MYPVAPDEASPAPGAPILKAVSWEGSRLELVLVRMVLITDQRSIYIKILHSMVFEGFVASVKYLWLLSSRARCGEQTLLERVPRVMIRSGKRQRGWERLSDFRNENRPSIIRCLGRTQEYNPQKTL